MLKYGGIPSSANLSLARSTAASHIKMFSKQNKKEGVRTTYQVVEIRSIMIQQSGRNGIFVW